MTCSLSEWIKMNGTDHHYKTKRTSNSICSHKKAVESFLRLYMVSCVLDFR